MEFTREDIIKAGEKEIASSRKLWRSWAIVALVAFIAGLGILILLLVLKELKDEENITSFIVFEIHTLGFTIFAFIYSYKREYDPFGAGRRAIESKYKGKLVGKVEYTTINPQPLYKNEASYDCYVIQKTNNESYKSTKKKNRYESRRRRAEQAGWDEEEMDLEEFEEYFED